MHPRAWKNPMDFVRAMMIMLMRTYASLMMLPIEAQNGDGDDSG